MRPLKLIISNFGPYLSETVDFTGLDNFFLISGPTGSGKTFIFDAILFALFGSVSGTREKESYISEFAAPGEKPFIDFSFKLNNKEFRIVRSPEYKRQKMRGTGTALVPTTAILHIKEKEGWKNETGVVTSINKKILDIINLTKDQFSKIILLPQGEFQKFLEDDTRGRGEILKKLFPTGLYTGVTELLKTKVNLFKKEMTSLFDQIDDRKTDLFPGYMDSGEGFQKVITEKYSIMISDKDKLLIKRNTIEDQLSELRIKATEAEKVLLEFEKRDKLNLEIGQLKVRFPQMDIIRSRIAAAHSAAPLYRDIRNLEEQKKNLSENKSRLAEIQAGLKSVLEEIEKSEIPRTEEIITIDKRLKELHGRNKQLETDYKRLPELKKQEESERTILLEKRGLEEEYNRNIECLGDIEREIEDIKETQIDIGKAAENLNRLRKKKLSDDKEKLVIKKNSEYDEIKEDLQNKESLLDILRHKKENSSAATLAVLLKDGRQCPVCGSKTHPFPADKKVPPFTEQEQLEDLELIINNLQKREISISAEISGITGEISILKADLQGRKCLDGETEANIRIELDTAERYEKKVLLKVKTKGELILKKENLMPGTQNLQKKLSDISVLLKGIQSTAASLKKEMSSNTPDTDLEKNNLEIAELEKHRTDLIQEKNELNEKAEHLTARRNELQHQIETAGKDYSKFEEKLNENISSGEFNNLEDIHSSRLDESEITELTDEIVKFDDSYSRKTGVLEDLKKTLETRSKPDVSAYKKDIQEKGDLLSDLDIRLEKLTKDLAVFDDNRRKLSDLEDKRKILEEKSGPLLELSNDLSGDNSKRISFTNFILGSYLEQVTLHATERLQRISDGRYSLFMSDKAEYKRGQYGLDLDIFDVYTGKRRSVKSLSGGEKFITSLSLALGLADVIQERAGGIYLESLFIDEGFGTLDDHSLDNALNILDEIRDNRIIGIISHVSELKTRIQTGIEVKSGKNGSTIKQIRSFT